MYHNNSMTIDYPLPLTQELMEWNLLKTARWTWSCRTLDPQGNYQLLLQDIFVPETGDVAMVRVENTGYHTRITTASGERLRLYPDDLMVCVFGNRYATDAYEAEVTDTKNLHILTDAGMIGSVLSKNERMKSPTKVRFIGSITNAYGQRINLKRLFFKPSIKESEFPEVIFAVGSGMNSGKTTTVSKLVKALIFNGNRIAVSKLTGSVSAGDFSELRSVSSQDVRDFSDYGFPSTYLCGRNELFALFKTMLSDASRSNPDFVVMEIADGLLQRETRILLEDPEIKKYVKGIVFTATCASSAIFGIERIRSLGHNLLAVSGVITNAPLYVRELKENNSAPVASSVGNGEELATLVMKNLRKLR
ncbi:MAG: hypothetical protein MRJ65_03190 [Candidatus Brocadiaceae bacterium]|nr:hypothetical protein [Candidatus Brocadiaceae bacterium]